MTLSHAILLASAGTGKTYRLVHRVLGLLLSGASLDGLVATTFTRKAAGQILERVLERLAQAVRDDDAREEVRRELVREGLELDSLDRARCLALLGRLLRSIHAARVSTLDAWFVQAVSLEALELGLPPGWSLAADDEDAALRAAAVSRLVAESDDVHLVGLLADQRGRDRATARGVHAAVLEVVGQGYDLLQAAAPDAWEVWQPPEPPPEDEVREALARFAERDLPVTKAGAPVKAWVSARDAIVAEVQAYLAGDPVDTSLLSKGLLGKVLAGEASFSKHELDEDLVECVAPFIGALGAPLLEEVARRTRSRHELLTAFAARYADAKRAARRYRFDDLPRLLAEGDGLGSETLAFRGLGRVEHLLLDEFQDTSLPQWLVLEPLARELFAEDGGSVGAAAGDGGRDAAHGAGSRAEPGTPPARSAFCVGDVKQSIYGWRGGEPRLLAGLGHEMGVEPETLELNYRSASVLLESATRVLSRVARWPALSEEPALGEAAYRWDQAWPPHRAARADLPGAVSLWEVGDPDDRIAARFAAVIERAADLAAEAAGASPHATVGVLVRGNRAIPRLLHALRRRGVAASGEGGNPVTDAEAVQLALSALHLADHPGDGLARLHVARSAFGQAWGFTDHADDEGAAALARRLRRELLERGYGEVLTAWQREVVEGGGDPSAAHAAFGPWDRRRFAQLVEQATAWDARADLRPSAFVAAVRASRVEDPDASRVKVMTLHAAKGLEFHAVILPELHGGLRVTESGVLVGHEDPLLRPDTVVTGAKRDVLPLDPSLEELAHQTWGRAFEESLCLLYVGLTRAMRRLDVVLPVAGKGDPKLALGGLVRWGLAERGADAPGADEGADVGGAGADGEARGGEEASGGGEGQPDGGPDTDECAEPAAGRLLWRAPGSDLECLADIEPEGGDEGEGQGEGEEPQAPDAAQGAADGQAALREPGRELSLPPAPAPRALPTRSPSGLEGGGMSRASDLLSERATGALDRGTVMHLWFEQTEWLDGFSASDEELRDLAVMAGHDCPELAHWLSEFRQALARPEVAGLLTAPADELQREVLNERDFVVRLTDEDGAPFLLNGSIDRLVITRRGEAVETLDVIDWKSDAVADDAALEERVAFYTPQLEAYRRAAAVLCGVGEERVGCWLGFVQVGRVVRVGG